MDLEEILPGVFHAHFERRRDLGLAFCRVQEHYESPEFKGKVFSWDEFKSWYTANSKEGRQTGKFTYPTDWSGFNVPDTAFLPFFGGEFDPLRVGEARLVEAMKGKGRPFYVLGTFGKNDVRTLRHEVGHALFHIDPNYRQEALAIVSSLPPELRAQFDAYFAKSAGYHPDVWDDEVQAHLISSSKKLEKKGISVVATAPYAQRMNDVFSRYCDLEF